MGTVPTLKSGLEFLLTRNSDVKKKGGFKKRGANFQQKPAPKHPLYWCGNPPKAEIVPPDQVGWSGIIYVLRVRRASEYECARPRVTASVLPAARQSPVRRRQRR
jgi:hypothetical protein